MVLTAGLGKPSARPSAEVRSVFVKNGRAIGVALASGEEIDTKMIIANASAEITFLELIEEKELPATTLASRCCNRAGGLSEKRLHVDVLLKRRMTFSRMREIGPSKPRRHKLPQKVIEPTENTAPPDGLSK